MLAGGGRQEAGRDHSLDDGGGGQVTLPSLVSTAILSHSRPRLVSRNTTIVDVRAAVSLFVAAWAEFSRAVLQKVADIEASCAGELRQLVRLFSELILHEIEKILLEETSKDLLSCVSQSTVPHMQDLIFIGQFSVLKHKASHCTVSLQSLCPRTC